MNNREFGYFGEGVAAEYLASRGFTVAARNYYAAGGELDLVAYDDRFLVFVEVKTRYNGQSLRYGRPASAVNSAKRNAVAGAAKQYLFDHPTKLQPRIDVIEIIVSEHRDTEGGVWYFVDDITHIENAVTASSGVRYGSRDRRPLRKTVSIRTADHIIISEAVSIPQYDSEVHL